MLALKVMLVIPTRNGADELTRLMESLAKQRASIDVCVIDSSSSDRTVDVARHYGALVHSIDVSDFNHGGTRQLIVDQHPNYDAYIFMTQDSYLADSEGLDHIVAPFLDPAVGAVCGRQLPHLDANPFAMHARFFNYPSCSRVKSINDAAELGIKTAFISNSFAAYRREALIKTDGFPKHVVLSEDMYVAARMLIAGWKVAYAANAVCRHSHNYSLMEEFNRYFDQGVFHAREPWIRERFGGTGGEGLRFVASEFRFLGLSHWRLWPEALIRNALKLLAYKLGQKERLLPICFKRRLAMHKRYWDGPFSEGK